MESFVLEGGHRLEGVACVDSAKNAVLPLMAACVLSEEAVELTEVPEISMVERAG